MKILVYPTFDNPYQRLLYNEVKKNKNITITFFDDGFYKSHYILGLIMFPLRLIYYRLKGFSIFHLHWQHFEIPFFFKYIQYLLSTIYALFILLIIKILDYKLVWTIHNLTPHKQQFINDLWITKIIISLSSRLIVHSPDTEKVLLDLGVLQKKITIIPQGSYIEEYPNNITQKDARTFFNIPQNNFVILFFGAIREYKGIEDLFEAFKELSQVSNIKLLIAGHVFDNNYKVKLEHLINSFNKKIIYTFEYIPNDKLQYYFNASNLVVFPFKKNTNSSSTLLSLSFGKPIIAPLLGGLSDLPKEVGFFYRNTKDLGYEIKRAINNANELKKKSHAALQFAHSLSWIKSGKSTYEIYKSLSTAPTS